LHEKTLLVLFIIQTTPTTITHCLIFANIPHQYLEPEREVFSRSRKIDLVVKCSDADYAQLQNTPFAHFRQLNSIEFKGINDPLTVANYFRIMMRVWALGDQQRIGDRPHLFLELFLIIT